MCRGPFPGDDLFPVCEQSRKGGRLACVSGPLYGVTRRLQDYVHRTTDGIPRRLSNRRIKVGPAMEEHSAVYRLGRVFRIVKSISHFVGSLQKQRGWRTDLAADRGQKSGGTGLVLRVPQEQFSPLGWDGLSVRSLLRSARSPRLSPSGGHLFGAQPISPHALFPRIRL